MLFCFLEQFFAVSNFMTHIHHNFLGLHKIIIFCVTSGFFYEEKKKNPKLFLRFEGNFFILPTIEI